MRVIILFNVLGSYPGKPFSNLLTNNVSLSFGVPGYRPYFTFHLCILLVLIKLHKFTFQITTTLEQRCYKDLRTENFHSVKVVMCIYRKLLISCKDQM